MAERPTTKVGGFAAIPSPGALRAPTSPTRGEVIFWCSVDALDRRQTATASGKTEGALSFA